jgi:hypothetical protein
MDFGNNFIGCTLSEGYTCIFLFPLGIEILYFGSLIEISFTIWPISIGISFSKNKSLFNS